MSDKKSCNCKSCRTEAVFDSAYRAYLKYISRLISEQLCSVDDHDSSASRVRQNVLGFHKLTNF